MSVLLAYFHLILATKRHITHRNDVFATSGRRRLNRIEHLSCIGGASISPIGYCGQRRPRSCWYCSVGFQHLLHKIIDRSPINPPCENMIARPTRWHHSRGERIFCFSNYCFSSVSSWRSPHHSLRRRLHNFTVLIKDLIVSITESFKIKLTPKYNTDFTSLKRFHKSLTHEVLLPYCKVFLFSWLCCLYTV